MHSLPALRIGLHFEGGLGQFYTFLINNTETLDIINTAPVKRIETYEHKMQISPRNHMRSPQMVQILHKHQNAISKGSNPYHVVILSLCSAINTSHNPEPIHTRVNM